jgi:hypothetical protein
MSLLLAITLWFLIKKNVETTLRPELVRPVFAPEAVKNQEPPVKQETADKPVRRAIPVDSPRQKSEGKKR